MRKIFTSRINSNAVSIWLLIARLLVGGLMLTHGIPKLQNLVEGNIHFADPIGIGEKASMILTVFAEVVCSVLLILGAATRFASVPLIINMSVVIFIVFAKEPLAKKELPIFFLLIYLGLLICGAGKFSVDSLIGGKSRSRY